MKDHVEPVDGNAGRKASIDAACLRMSYRILPVTAVATTITGCVVAWVLSAEVPTGRLAPWLASVWIMGGLRLALDWWIRRRVHTDEDARRLAPLFAVVMVTAGAIWGALIFVTGLSTSMLVVATITLAVAGMMASGAVSQAGTPRVAMATSALSLGPLGVWMGLSGVPSIRALLVLVVVHAVAVLTALRFNNRSARDSVGLRFENVELAERLEAEKVLETAARREAEAANQEKSRFLAAASHDARQPLHALGLFVDNLKSQELSPRARELVSSIEQAQRSLVALHEGLLDLSTLQVGQLELRRQPVGLLELLRAVETESAPRARQRGLSLRVAGADLTAMTDAALVLRVLRNLVANAIAYTETGGVLLAVRRRGERALVQVWDTGIGIPRDQYDRIFDELYQVGNAARDRQQGLGLGLSIVKRLTTALGCEVGVRSRVGRGSLFWFELPLATSVAVSQPRAALPLDGPEGAHGQVLLLVDDDGLAREALGALLEHWGYEVAAASSAEEAQEYAAQLERLDVVVSDLRLPGRSGLELLVELASARPAVTRVAISGDTEPGLEARVGGLGAAFLRKPVQAAALREVLELAARAKSG
jgi:signal transduction histidine kinase/CheY-like chemotaxis protein